MQKSINQQPVYIQRHEQFLSYLLFYPFYLAIYPYDYRPSASQCLYHNSIHLPKGFHDFELSQFSPSLNVANEIQYELNQLIHY